MSHYDREANARRAYDQGVRAIASDLQRISTRDRHRMAMDARNRHLSPVAQRVAGALWCYLGPRLAHDAAMPDVGEMVEGIDRRNLRGSRKLIGDRVKRMMRGRLGRDALDLDDLEDLLASLEEAEGEEEGEDHIFDRHATDEPEPSPGRPQPGGNMDPMRDFNDTRFPQTKTDPAEGPLDGEDRARRRRAHDSAPQSFADRFPFTTVATPGAVDWTKIS